MITRWVLAAVAAVVWMSPCPAAQQSVFRSSVELVAIDAQVLGPSGAPVQDLGADRFSVTLNGKARRVVSADLIRLAEMPAVIAEPRQRAVATNELPDAAPGRTFELAIDTSSFETNAWQRSAMALRTFLAALPPPDLVGVYAYPFGPWLAPTRDRAAIRRALDGVTGTYQPMRTHFHLEPSEVIDINAEMARIGSPATAVRRIGQVALDPGTDAPTVRSVQDRECPADPNCSARILLDASAAAQDLEASLTQRIDGLRSMLQTLSVLPGRKTVVLVSAGMVVSDRVGGRPEPSDMASALGTHLAQANSVIYTVHLDRSVRDGYSAAARRLNTSNDPTREASLRAGWLDALSAASGGTLISAQTDDGEDVLQQVLRETSSYYLLGVEPASGDRDGKLREVRVRVSGGRQWSVRYRQWVIIPKGLRTLQPRAVEPGQAH